MINKIVFSFCLLLFFVANAHAQCSGSESQEGDYCYTVAGGKVTISRYIGTGGDVVIPAIINGMPVTNIGENAFYSCKSLTSVVIPNSVTIISYSAFDTCESLASVVIGNSVTTIDSWAFAGCVSLVSVDMPDSLTIIGAGAFWACPFTSITIPGSVTIIGDWAFAACSSLTSVVIPEGITIIGGATFRSCISLTSVTLPDSVTSIGDYAFAYCNSLTGIVIPDSVISIGDSVFVNSKALTSIVIPDSVTSIGDFAFQGCSALTSATIGNSITAIGQRTFHLCKSLTSVVFGNSVSSIGWEAFNGCSALPSIIIPESVTSLGESAFQYCESLTSVSLPKSINSIRRYTFSYCRALTSVAIPSSVISIDSAAFQYCESLTSITIPSSVISIGDHVFLGSSALSAITVHANNPSYSSHEGVLYNKARTRLILHPEGKSGEYVIPDSVNSIGAYAFAYCRSLTSVVIPDSVTTIEGQAFIDCSTLTRVAIPASVTSIGSGAFRNCHSLSVAYFLGNAPSMDSHVFYKSAPGFKICYTAQAAGFTTPTWAGYPATICPCEYDSDCGKGALCEEGVCVECLDDSDCNDSVACNGEETCDTGLCVAGETTCPKDTYCDEVFDVCSECLNDSHCGVVYSCEEGMCVRGPNYSPFTTVSLRGPGALEVAYAPDLQHIAGIELTGTTEESSLTITTSAKNRVVRLDELYIMGSMKSINAKPIALIGAMTVTGGIAKLQLAETGSDSSIEAAWIDKLQTGGDFAGHVGLTGEETSSKGFTLGKATIKGALVDSVWHVSGDVGSFLVGSWGAGSVLAVGVDRGDDNLFFTGDDVATVGSLGKFKYKYYDIDNGGEKFGIIAAEFLKNKLTLPFGEGDFIIRQP